MNKERAGPTSPAFLFFGPTDVLRFPVSLFCRRRRAGDGGGCTGGCFLRRRTGIRRHPRLVRLGFLRAGRWRWTGRGARPNVDVNLFQFFVGKSLCGRGGGSYCQEDVVGACRELGWNGEVDVVISGTSGISSSVRIRVFQDDMIHRSQAVSGQYVSRKPVGIWLERNKLHRSRQ